MWPLAECTNSLLVRTPSLQLGVLQITTRFIPNSFDPFLSPCQPIPLVETRAKSSPVRHQVTMAQVGHKGVNPFTSSILGRVSLFDSLSCHLASSSHAIFGAMGSVFAVGADGAGRFSRDSSKGSGRSGGSVVKCNLLLQKEAFSNVHQIGGGIGEHVVYRGLKSSKVVGERIKEENREKLVIIDGTHFDESGMQSDDVIDGSTNRGGIGEARCLLRYHLAYA